VEVPVVEFYTVKRIDNSRLVNRHASGLWRSCRRQLLLGGVVALALLIYAWQHFEFLQLSYQLERMDQAQTQAVELNGQLKVELATLRSPARIDLLARSRLGMTVPQAAQIIQTQPAAAGEIAQANAVASPSNFR
jgi:cell division protein FtsL